MSVKWYCILQSKTLPGPFWQCSAGNAFVVVKSVPAACLVFSCHEVVGRGKEIQRIGATPAKVKKCSKTYEQMQTRHFVKAATPSAIHLLWRYPILPTFRSSKEFQNVPLCVFFCWIAICSPSLFWLYTYAIGMSFHIKSDISSHRAWSCHFIEPPARILFWLLKVGHPSLRPHGFAWFGDLWRAEVGHLIL